MLRRDVAESLTRVPWLHYDLRAAIWFWKRTTRVLDKYRQDARFHFVSFEHLVTSPEEALRGVVEHLQLNWDSSVDELTAELAALQPRLRDRQA